MHEDLVTKFLNLSVEDMKKDLMGILEIHELME